MKEILKIIVRRRELVPMITYHKINKAIVLILHRKNTFCLSNLCVWRILGSYTLGGSGYYFWKYICTFSTLICWFKRWQETVFDWLVHRRYIVMLILFFVFVFDLKSSLFNKMIYQKSHYSEYKKISCSLY